MPPVSEAELAQRDGRGGADLWIALGGTVYDVTDFRHPGGRARLLSVAGRDGTAEFMAQHAYISAQAMLRNRVVGRLVVEPPSAWGGTGR
jgi:cytochrome b involved in lipid metabolism